MAVRSRPSVSSGKTAPEISYDPLALDALMQGTHGDPFSLLGVRPLGKGWGAMTLQPAAVAVSVLSAKGKVLGVLDRVRDGGLFTGKLSCRNYPLGYRLQVDYGNNHVQELDDPYRFGPLLGELDLHLLGEGTHEQSWQVMGAHPCQHEGVSGVRFAVWAPSARRVAVVGPFNGWDGRRHGMRKRHEAGIWEIFLPGLQAGALYKYEITGPDGTVLPLKADPYGLAAEQPPLTASQVVALQGYQWQDQRWLAERAGRHSRQAPLSVYEVHLGSWRRKAEENNRVFTYQELACDLGAHVRSLGFTHIELLPVHEHPFTGSWGYQPIGLYAPTSRYGSPDDFRAFVDSLHQQGIGVIIDWVAGHFPTDAHGLGNFDGTQLYEHADPRQGMHRDWNTLIYNYGRREVVNYLVSNALYWLEEFHIDGLRVDAVASMLYLDYSRDPGDWVPNVHGGRENLEAVAFLRRMNDAVMARFPDVLTIAEESTSWPLVSRPTAQGGLGFRYKWNMGWMNDTLRYCSKDPIHRRYHHDQMTFGLMYAFSEDFILPLSHDEVVHGKGSLLGKMPGDRWQKLATLRAYLTFMYAHPGKKLLFMGAELAQEREWSVDRELDWSLLQDPAHDGIRRLIADLNQLYRREPALHQQDNDPAGFRWVECEDSDHSVLSWLRLGGGQTILCVLNFTPVVRNGYRVGVPGPGVYRTMLNSDSAYYGGSNAGPDLVVQADPIPWHTLPWSVSLTLPPLGGLLLVQTE